MHRIVTAGRLAATLAAIAAVTALYDAFVHVNPTTVALSYLVVILAIATGWGLIEATTASLTAVLCFNFFFLPPTRTFTVADPQNWIALVAFLLTAIITSQLSGRARQRELDATVRGRDLERLYALSRALLLSERGSAIRREIARQIADIFELESVGLYDRTADSVSWAGPANPGAFEDRLREVAMRAASIRDADGWIIVAIQLGGAPIGSLALSNASVSDTVLNSIANLAAIGLERARADEATARAEAARQSSELRATVLDALAHDFKTPLTSMKAASSDLLSRPSLDPESRELAAIIDEDVERLDALVTDAVHMLRIDTGRFTVHRARHPLAALVAATVKQFEQRLDGHAIVQRVPADMSVEVDRLLLALALRQLLDNAVKYSPATSTITIAARDGDSVEIDVHNSDSVIPAAEQERIFDRFFRGAHAAQVPGTGLGLAIVQRIAQAHGGTLHVTSGVESGTTFTLVLPRVSA